MKRLSDGTWVDAETGELIAASLPLSLQSAVDALLGACCVLGKDEQIERVLTSPGACQRNKNLRARAKRKLAELETEHMTLVARIEHGWGWCDRHRDHERFEERDGHVVAWIGQYESIQRAITAAKGALA